MPSRKILLGSASAAVLVFALLALWAWSGGAAWFDSAIRETVHTWASPSLTRVLIGITTLGSELFLVPVGALVVWRFAVRGRGRQALLLPLFSLGAEVVSQVLKLVIHRARPAVFFGLSPAETYSFPSGHAFVSTVFYGLLALLVLTGEPSRRLRHTMLIMAVSAPLLIGFSRVYLGYHHASDVLGGWTGAIAWLSLAGLALRGSLDDQARQSQEQHH